MRDELFVHLDDAPLGNGAMRCWNVARLYADCVSGVCRADRVDAPIRQEGYSLTLSQPGISEERIAQVLASPQLMSAPGLFLRMPRGTHLLMCGRHQYLARWRVGLHTMDAFVIDLHEAEPYRVELPHAGSIAAMAHDVSTKRGMSR